MRQMSQPKPEKHTYLNPVYCLNFAEVDEVVGDGVDCEAGLGMDVEFGDDIAAVGCRCMDGNAEPVGDLFV